MILSILITRFIAKTVDVANNLQDYFALKTSFALDTSPYTAFYQEVRTGTNLKGHQIRRVCLRSHPVFPVTQTFDDSRVQLVQIRA